MNEGGRVAEMGGSSPTTDLFGGVRVVEFAQFVFVPVTGALLADWGADVVKIEHPVTGDGYRGLVSQGIGASSGTVNVSMEMANRGKRSLALDAKRPQGREVLLRMVERADVFLTNALPSSLDRLRLGVDDLRAVNPSIIYARGHGFGARGPEADMPGYDSTAFWARGGLGDTLTPQGLGEPIGQRGALGDRNGAVQLAFGIAAALFRRERTGEGTVVDVSLLSTAIWMLASDVMAALQGSYQPARLPAPGKQRVSPNPLVANYRCADGRYLTLCFLQPDRYWPDLCRAIERPDLAADPRFADIRIRAQHAGACIEALQAAFARRTLAEWRVAFAKERFPWAPFQSVTEIASDPQVVANGYIAAVDDGDVHYSLPTGAVQFDQKPASIRRAPGHGQHTDEVLLELGYDWDQIIELKLAEVVA
jgi:crotonobetainyl-CoA:carnitine CoA-transferase CaiB-like acyl-CoA transferase